MLMKDPSKRPRMKQVIIIINLLSVACLITLNSSLVSWQSYLFNGKIDHGNHYHTTNYYLSNFCLVHYHCRNLEQMKKKIFNNISGLGHSPFNLSYLKTIEKSNPDGIHHIRNQIQILENTFNLPIDMHSNISLFPLINKILAIS